MGDVGWTESLRGLVCVFLVRRMDCRKAPVAKEIIGGSGCGLAREIRACVMVFS